MLERRDYLIDDQPVLEAMLLDASGCSKSGRSRTHNKDRHLRTAHHGEHSSKVCFELAKGVSLKLLSIAKPAFEQRCFS